MKRTEQENRSAGAWAHPGAVRGNAPTPIFWQQQALDNARRARADIARIDTTDLTGAQSMAVLRAKAASDMAIEELQKLFPREA